MRNRKRTWLLRRLVLGLAVAAVVAPTAQARIDEGGRGQSDQTASVRPDDKASRFSPVAIVGNVALRPDDRASRFSPVATVGDLAVRPDDKASRFSPVGTIGDLAVRPDDRASRPGPSLGTAAGKDYSQYAYRRALPQDISTQPVQVVSKPDGFDWGDAGIGAGALFGVILLAGGATLATRHLNRTATA
jgi:hypothetical protein